MISSRAKLLKPSPTMAMANRARELAAQGKSVVSLTLGEPDWPTSPAACEAGIRAIKEGFTRYTAAAGMPELRQALARTLSEELGIAVRESQVVVGAGAKFVIFAALQMLVDPGEEVLIPAPYWVSYPTMVELAGGTSVIVPCSEKENFKLSAEKLEKAITPQTKVLILCSPSNPTGINYTREELSLLAEVLRRHPQVIIISDDIYNRLIFSDEKTAPHLLHVAPDLESRLVAVNGASKSFAMTGWRVGWAVCPPSLAKAMADFFSQSTSNVSSVTQRAVLAALENPEPEIKKARELLRSRYQLMCQGLSAIPGLRVVPAQGAFYIWLNVEEWIGKTYAPSNRRVKDSGDLADLLLDQQFVATVPGIEFGSEGYLRLSFACSESDLQMAIDRFKKFGAQLS